VASDVVTVSFIVSHKTLRVRSANEPEYKGKDWGSGKRRITGEKEFAIGTKVKVIPKHCRPVKASHQTFKPHAGYYCKLF
jgi:predicted chitinase